MGVSSPNSASQIFKILFFAKTGIQHSVISCTVPLYCSTHCRTAVRAAAGASVGASGSSVVSEHRKRAAESRSVGDRSQFPTSKPLGTIAERHGAMPMLWEPLEPRESMIRPPDPSLGRLKAPLRSTIPSGTVVGYT